MISPSATNDPQLKWFKSSYSTNDGPECVEVALTPCTVHIRDSKNKQGPRLTFTPEQWAIFVPYAVGL
ncbi:DUF397 domain-containing protein [Streptomyces poonensis]|uniref:DUF397 domain-containing protein n=2 Tax=Streptomyces poonensis TaxID=68255 RepID=A0A918Q706_9ACTN|nr:DUF397 domain-containing protein [Streptomyces poonensis]GLJ93160.1 DUF397 domain-containing protein [Streptomyces poonensis]